MPRGAREKRREQEQKERKRQRVEVAQSAGPDLPAEAEPEATPDPETLHVAAEIADQLGETAEEPRETIRRAVERLGAERALAFLQETLAVEAQGGMWLGDGSRRRTPGGVFFYLVRQRVEKPDRLAIFYPEHEPIVPLTGEDLAPLLAGAGEWPRSQAERLRITLVGRPASIPPADAPPETPYVIFNLEGSAARLPTLPNELPPLVAATTFRVLAPTEQWRKIGSRLLERQDALISVSGDVAINPKRPEAITVRAAVMKLVVPPET